ncbi:unnamed protein product [Rotaria sordida]|uniref:Uncharacterized protein n=1 Tax=Rotaria sordida TaxID=392033 RepID=A0A815JZ89_9BILA|nr:unnamed protein product [Rotaria sordida]
MYEQISNCDSRLNTPNSLVFDTDNVQYQFGCNSNLQAQLSSTQMNPSHYSHLLSNHNQLMQRMNILLLSMQEIKQDILTMKTDIDETKKLQSTIITMLQPDIQSKILMNQNNQQFAESDFIEHIDDLLLNTGEIMDCQNQEIFQTEEASTSRNGNFMVDNQENHTMPSLFDSDLTGFDYDSIILGCKTTNVLNSEDELSALFNEYGKLPTEQNQGKNRRSKPCRDSSSRKVEQLSDPLFAIDQGKTKKKNQRKHERKSKKNSNTSISDSIDYQLSPHLTTANEIPAINHDNDESIKICLCHPLKTQLSGQTDRNTTITDCFGKTPVLVLFGNTLPDQFDIKMAMISSSLHGCVYSVQQFSKEIESTRTICCSERTISSVPVEISLENLKLHKKCDKTMMKEDTFKVKMYPSDVEKDTKLTKQKDVNSKYELKYSQLYIDCFQQDSSIPLPFNFRSNKLSTALKTKSMQQILKISIQSINGSTILFDSDNKYPIILSGEIPEMFHCTLRSGWKWLKISIITDNKPSSIYYIDLGNGDKKNPNYFNIHEKSFTIPLNIVKKAPGMTNNVNVYRTLCSNQSEGPINNPSDNESFQNQNDSRLTIQVVNCFRIEILLLHSKSFPNESSIIYYPQCPTWNSEDFKEYTSISSNSERTSIQEGQQAVSNFAQMQINQLQNEPCNNTIGWPFTRASTTNTNNKD